MLDAPPAIVCAPPPRAMCTANGAKNKKSAAFELQPWCGQHLTGQEPAPVKNVYNYAQMDELKEKTPMCRIAELARYNKLKHEYKLMDESGPAHKKRFTVSLVLTPDQVFDGCGASIKKAQQAAADAALKATTLPRPPERNTQKKFKKDPRNPQVLLGYVAHRLGLEVNFSDMGPPIYAPPPSLMTPPSRPPANAGFMPLLTDRFFPPSHPAFIQMCRPPPIPMILPPNGLIPGYSPLPQPVGQRIYQVRLTLSNDTEFIGRGPTKQKARFNAAAQALLHLGPKIASFEAEAKNSAEKNDVKNEQKTETDGEGCANDKNTSKGSDEDCSDRSTGSGSDNGTSPPPDSSAQHSQAVTRNGKPKSAISQIHECALQMRMNVEFEILSEEGPAHDRHYALRCKMISPEETIIADGEGGSKKIAKQNACALMLTKLKALETSPIFIASALLKSQKKSTVSKEAKRKTIIKDMKMDPDYGHQINPVSRLMQVMQARKQPEPKFELIGEHGQSRYKEFVVEVTCADGSKCEGTGPNKKLAKRAAAEAMLAKIGYVKPMPKPGKSLLKKRTENRDNNGPDCPVEIGVFNPDELMTPSPVTPPANSVIDEWKSESPAVTTSESISEVTLSVTATIGSHVMTFADVDRAARADEQRSVWGASANDSNSDSDSPSSRREEATVAQPTTAPKRRVTFSNEVSACPPPDDSSYPSALITPLKSEMLFVSKMRRRGRDSKKTLTNEQKSEMAKMAREFLAGWNPGQNTALVKTHIDHTPKVDNSIGMFVVPPPDLSQQMGQLSLGGQSSGNFWPPNGHETLVVETARHRLERIAESIKFSISYSDFPKAQNDTDNQYFSLVSLGIDKPIVCHGSGISEEAAHDNAAYNALLALSTYDLPNPICDLN